MRALIKDKDTDETWPLAKERTYVPALERGLIDRARARLDVDASGDTEQVIRVRVRLASGGCEAEKEKWFRYGHGLMPQEFRYYVLDEGTGELDPHYGIVGLVSATHGLFLYKGRVYIGNFTGVSIRHRRKKAKAWNVIEVDDPEAFISVSELGGGSREQFYTQQVCVAKVFYEIDKD